MTRIIITELLILFCWGSLALADEPPPLPKDASIENSVSNSLDMTLVLVPSGKFTMGSPLDETKRRSHEKQRVIVVSESFYLSSTEVTQKQWRQLMHSSPWSEKLYVREGDQYPATYIDWSSATDFCQKLSEREGKAYRLPTEAEWEYACRGGTATAFGFGSEAKNLAEHGWYGKNTFDVGERYAHEVGTKKANSLGLFDMHGNVWEWCSDWYVPESPQDSSRTMRWRVVRGGSWHGPADLCRSASRFRRQPPSVANDLGFRVAMDRP